MYHLALASTTRNFFSWRQILQESGYSTRMAPDSQQLLLPAPVSSLKVLTVNALPVELLYSIHLWALNPAFPLANRFLYATMKKAPSSISARYLFYRHDSTSLDLAGLISRVLKYPLCTPDVFERFLSILPAPYRHLYPNPRQTANAPPVVETPLRLFRLPRRLFRDLGLSDDTTDRSDPDATFKFLESLYKLPPVSYPGTTRTQAVLPDSNSHDGYPLIKAVQAKNRRLINLLLSHKADPSRNHKMAVLLAIQQRDLTLVKLLVEGTPKTRQIKVSKTQKGTKKEGDLVKVDNIMLGVAVKEKAMEIVEWLVKEKGVVPDIKTLRSIE